MNAFTDVVTALVRRGEDMTMRQAAVLLSVARAKEPRTVRGMAAEFRVPSAAITRALDRLENLSYARRIPDPSDGRSVLVVATSGGFDMAEAMLGEPIRRVA